MAQADGFLDQRSRCESAGSRQAGWRAAWAGRGSQAGGGPHGKGGPPRGDRGGSWWRRLSERRGSVSRSPGAAVHGRSTAGVAQQLDDLIGRRRHPRAYWAWIGTKAEHRRTRSRLRRAGRGRRRQPALCSQRFVGKASEDGHHLGPSFANFERPVRRVSGPEHHVNLVVARAESAEPESSIRGERADCVETG